MPAAGNRTQISAGPVACCESHRFGFGEEARPPLDGIATIDECEARCMADAKCSFFSHHGRLRRCALCAVCELGRTATTWTSWAVSPGGYTSFEPVDAVVSLEQIIAPLELNESYSDRLYGGRGLMPPLASLRILWLALLPEQAIRALSRVSPPCQLAARPPWRPLVSAVDVAFANPRDALWLYRPIRREAVPNGSWVEVTHCADRRPLRLSGMPAWKYHPMWLYEAPGSGVSVNVGRTLAVDSYEEAAALLERLFPGELALHSLSAARGCNGSIASIVNQPDRPPLDTRITAAVNDGAAAGVADAGGNPFPLAHSVLDWVQLHGHLLSRPSQNASGDQSAYSKQRNASGGHIAAAAAMAAAVATAVGITKSGEQYLSHRYTPHHTSRRLSAREYARDYLSKTRYRQMAEWARTVHISHLDSIQVRACCICMYSRATCCVRIAGPVAVPATVCLAP